MYNVLYDAPVPDLEHLVDLLRMACGKCNIFTYIHIYICVCVCVCVWCYTFVYKVLVVTAPMLP